MSKYDGRVGRHGSKFDGGKFGSAAGGSSPPDLTTRLMLSANTVLEGAANGTVVGTVSVFDPLGNQDDGGTFARTAQSNANWFAIHATTGVITVSSSSPDFETNAGPTISVSYDDGVHTPLTQAFTVTVTDVVAPVVTVLPSISGGTDSGDLITGTDGTYTYTAPLSLEYRWMRALTSGGVPIGSAGAWTGVAIAAATSANYTTTGDDVGEFIFRDERATGHGEVGSWVSSSNYIGLIVSSDAPETTAFLARTSGLDATHTNAYKALINGMVADVVLAKGDALVIPATKDNTTANLNLISTSYTATNHGATWTADHGYTGGANGAGKYISTGIDPAATTHYSRNSMCHAVWFITANTQIFGFNGWAADDFSIECEVTGSYGDGVTAGTARALAHNGTNVDYGSSPGVGLFAINRSASGAVQFYVNGVQVATSAGASVAIPAGKEIYMLARQYIGVPNTESDATIGAYWEGESLSAGEHADLYARLQTFLTAVGAI